MTDTTSGTADAPSFAAPIPPDRLLRRREIAIDTAPDADAARAIAAELGLQALRAARLRGTLRPAGRDDWTLDARLTATAIQTCGVTLAPVTTRIDTPVARRFIADWPDPGPGERRMTEDEDTDEPLGRNIDPGAILVAELSLALPDHPRAPGAALDPQGDDANDVAHRPFAGLAGKLDTGD